MAPRTDTGLHKRNHGQLRCGYLVSTLAVPEHGRGWRANDRTTHIHVVDIEPIQVHAQDTCRANRSLPRQRAVRVRAYHTLDAKPTLGISL